eukprot:2741208-Rhodomonas_salina.1
MLTHFDARSSLGTKGFPGPGEYRVPGYPPGVPCTTTVTNTVPLCNLGIPGTRVLVVVALGIKNTRMRGVQAYLQGL